MSIFNLFIMKSPIYIIVFQYCLLELTSLRETLFPVTKFPSRHPPSVYFIHSERANTSFISCRDTTEAT